MRRQGLEPRTRGLGAEIRCCSRVWTGVGECCGGALRFTCELTSRQLRGLSFGIEDGLADRLALSCALARGCSRRACHLPVAVGLHSELRRPGGGDKQRVIGWRQGQACPVQGQTSGR